MDEDLIHLLQMQEAQMLVGGYLLSWGQLETAFASGFHNVAPHRRGPHIDPKDVSKTLSHLAKEWAKEVKKLIPGSTYKIDHLVATIIEDAKDRNTICHGWQGVITKRDNPEYSVACWHKFHETRSTGAFPEQRFFDRSELTSMVHTIQMLTEEVKKLTNLALVAQEKARDPKELSGRQTQFHVIVRRP